MYMYLSSIFLLTLHQLVTMSCIYTNPSWRLNTIMYIIIWIFLFEYCIVICKVIVVIYNCTTEYSAISRLCLIYEAISSGCLTFLANLGIVQSGWSSTGSWCILSTMVRLTVKFPFFSSALVWNCWRRPFSSWALLSAIHLSWYLCSINSYIGVDGLKYKEITSQISFYSTNLCIWSG